MSTLEEPQNDAADAGAVGVVRSRLRPPRSRAGNIDRPRLTRALWDVVTAPVLVVEADAGYGKTTVADMITADVPRFWYGLTPADRDPLVFLAHLVTATQSKVALSASADELQGSEQGQDSPLDRSPHQWPRLLDQFIEDIEGRSDSHIYLVLDDYHNVYRSPVDAVLVRLIDQMPPNLHLVVTSREHLELSGWIRSRARGDIRDIGRDVLAFDTDETVAYFQAGFGIALTHAQAQLLTEDTEGWPIGLSLIGQRLRDRGQDPEALLAAMPEGRPEIFDFLGDQVFRDQPTRIREFLLAVSCLQVLDPDACAAVSESTRAQASEMLGEVIGRGFFCTEGGSGSYRLHHLFRDFLQAQLSIEQRATLDGRASDHFRKLGDFELAARYATRAGLLEEAATDVENAQPQLLATGRHLTLLALSDHLGDALNSHPRLHVGRSHALRLNSRYREAISEAQEAQSIFDSDSEGAASAFAAEAMVYLDTVQPRRAYPSLAAMGRLSRPLNSRDRSQWLALLAENQVNAGRLRSAEHTLSRLEEFLPTNDVVAVRQRLLARRGELQRARALLDVSQPVAKAVIPHSHREDAALLAWIHGLLGHGDRAEGEARRGVSLGADLRSPIVSCVCWGRLGFAQICQNPTEPAEAHDSFLSALAIADEILVPRFRVEPLIGLTVIAHRLGDAGDTMRYGLEAISTLEAAGDGYLTAMASLGIGVALADQHNPEAKAWLNRARAEAVACGDAYVPLLADLWDASLALQVNDRAEFDRLASSALKATSELSLDDIWITPPWLGIYDFDQRRNWLEAARALPDIGGYAVYLSGRLENASNSRKIASRIGRPKGSRALYIQTLGTFAVQREGQALSPNKWTRHKAMQILWLLSSNERHSYSREEAMDILWEEESGETVGVRFRVALHALHLVLEPDRPSRAATRYVHTSPERLWLDLNEVEIDVDEFRRLAKLARELPGTAGLQAALEAIDLYHGPFLAEAPYLDWVIPTRDALAATFRDLTLSAAGQLIDHGDFSHAAALGRRVLEYDPYLESAYRIIAVAHLAVGDRVAAARIFDNCRRTLMDDLGVEPNWTLESLKVAMSTKHSVTPM